MKNYTYVFTFFENPKNVTFYVFELLHTFSRTLFAAVGLGRVAYPTSKGHHHRNTLQTNYHKTADAWEIKF